MMPNKKSKNAQIDPNNVEPSTSGALNFLANCLGLRRNRQDPDDELCRLFRLSRKELASFRVAFNMFDLDRDGIITSQELAQVLLNLGQSTKEDELKAMIEDVDVDHSGNVDFYEFLQMVTKRIDEKTKEEDLKDAFRVFDRDGDGQISMRELRLAMTRLGEILTGEELTEMMQTVDTNQDGHINFEGSFCVPKKRNRKINPLNMTLNAEFTKIIQWANDHPRGKAKK